MSYKKLHDLPAVYDSSRSRGDVLVGTDDAAALTEASSNGSVSDLQHLLANKQQSKIALAKPHRIYAQFRPGQVSAVPVMNPRTMLEHAAQANRVDSVHALITWGVAHQVPQKDLIDRDLVMQSLEVGKHDNYALLCALAGFDPAVLRHNLGHASDLPLYTVELPETTLLRVILEHGVTIDDFHNACTRCLVKHGIKCTPFSHAAGTVSQEHSDLLTQCGAEETAEDSARLASENRSDLKRFHPA